MYSEPFDITGRLSKKHDRDDAVRHRLLGGSAVHLPAGDHCGWIYGLPGSASYVLTMLCVYWQALDTLELYGRGPPVRLTGLSRSLFRPSDDAVTMGYNIPGNAMACTELTHITEVFSQSDDIVVLCCVKFIVLYLCSC